MVPTNFALAATADVTTSIVATTSVVSTTSVVAATAGVTQSI